jgi:hypothetical protein
MKTLALTGLAAAALLAGCASPAARGPDGNPELSRIDPAELARIPPARAPRLTSEEIVRLSIEGRTPPEIIVQRYKESGSRLNLTPAQAADLQRHGVSANVLEQIQQADQDAARADAADTRARQEAAASRRQDARYRTTQPYIYPPAYWSGGYYGVRPPGLYYGW